MPTKIILAGEGGQGVQAIAKIIALAAQNSDKISSYLPSFGVEQRGGVSIAYLQISSKPIPFPRFEKADIMVAFCDRAIKAVQNYITDNTLFVYDNSAISNKHLEKVKGSVRNYLALPAQKLGREKYTTKVSNMILLGGVAAHLKELNFQEFENAILEVFKDKIADSPEIKNLNLEALKYGLELAQNYDQGKQEFAGIDPPEIKRTFSNEAKSWSRFPEYCKGCSLCIVNCPVHALKFSNEVGFLGLPMPEVDINTCIGCLKCQQICPDGAIRVDKN